jgi:hypothetical protein
MIKYGCQLCIVFKTKTNTIMKYTFKLMAALIMVIGFTAANANGLDTIGAISYCRVVKVSSQDTYRVVYHGLEQSKTKIQLFDKDNNLVHVESMGSVDEFAKDYNFSELPEGSYTFKIISGSYEYEQAIDLVRWKADKLRFLEVPGGLALIGLNDSGRKISIILSDVNGRKVHQMEVEKGTELQTFLNLKHLTAQDVSISVYDGNRMVKQEFVKL